MQWIHILIFSSPDKQCAVHLIPTALLKDCIAVLGPVITSSVSISLSEGPFPARLTCVIVYTILKQPSVFPKDLSNCHPIAALNFISKILKKVVVNRLSKTFYHLSCISLCSLPIKNSILHYLPLTITIKSVNKGTVTTLLLVDLYATFDNVDYDIFHHRLELWFGLPGPALIWFASYLHPLTRRSVSVFS